MCEVQIMWNGIALILHTFPVTEAILVERNGMSGVPENDQSFRVN